MVVIVVRLVILIDKFNVGFVFVVIWFNFCVWWFVVIVYFEFFVIFIVNVGVGDLDSDIVVMFGWLVNGVYVGD